ncbi:MAG: GNAT family N-acetyltransferase [Nitrospira sp. LK265]|nr:GNAT family N-acetyltransferase [Nitrospira sp.]NGZ60496.1 GNAT family N-acetyltransferase [Nitrospira sp. LK265]
MIERIHIRPASQDDLDTIVMFNAAMALETEHRQLDLATLRQGALALLQSPGYGFYIVAALPGDKGYKPVGQLMITYEWSDWRNGAFWWIQSVYVEPPQRGLGVFRAMHDHILVRARADPRVCGIRLYVERENRRAQTVYQRVGLAPSVYTVFEQDFVLGHEIIQE